MDILSQKEPIAIIGMGCRFPGGADTPGDFWKLIQSGKKTAKDIPGDRWNIKKYYDPHRRKSGKMYIKNGNFLKHNIKLWDAPFFKISPREAASMDPQQRLLLEVSWEVMEDAGIDAGSVRGSNTGVFIGGVTPDHLLNQVNAGDTKHITPHTSMNVTLTMLSNRISYFYDFKGPSLTLDTACSSGLVAFHHACQSLWNKESDMAMTGGVNIIMRPEYSVALCKGGFLSPDGYCKSFDARANGYARGEGLGLVLLMPLSKALKAGHYIHALVRGSGVNHDGLTKSITIPNGESQSRLIRKVMKEAGVKADRISYVEAHGTGTSVGDPIEAASIGEAVGKKRKNDEPCFIGSVKANIGHLEAASGLAGIIKSVLCLKHKQIPPQANFEKENPAIPFKELKINIPRTSYPMPETDGCSFVGVNSFGYGGTNAHVLLESYNENPVSPPSLPSKDKTYVLPLSACNEPALYDLIKKYIVFLKKNPLIELKDLCFSAGARRTHHSVRLAVVFKTHGELLSSLKEALTKKNVRGFISKLSNKRGNRKPVFIFTGMGPQWWAMGRDLLKNEPRFIEAARECDALFIKHSGFSVLNEMLAEVHLSRMNETVIAQRANFLLQVSLMKWLGIQGIEPGAIVGHSAGEPAAAYGSGYLSLEEAVKVCCHRSRIQAKAAGKGGMLALEMNLSQLKKEYGAYFAEGAISVAAVNTSTSLTLSGDMDCLKVLSGELTDKGIFNRLLNVEVPFHSRHMEPFKEEILTAVKGLKVEKGRIPLYSTVTGEAAEDGIFSSAYWYENIRRPVLFAKALKNIINDGHNLFLEIGPHPVLSGAVKEILGEASKEGEVLFAMNRRKDDREAAAEMIQKLYMEGASLSWEGIYSNSRYIKLPGYPWQYAKFWNESEVSVHSKLSTPGHPLLGDRIQAPVPLWKNTLDQFYMASLEDYKIEDLNLLPWASYLEMGMALKGGINKGPVTIEDIHFQEAYKIGINNNAPLNTLFDEATGEFKISSPSGSKEPGDWVCHARGKISSYTTASTERLDLLAIKKIMAETPIVTDLYGELFRKGYQYGESFKNVKELRINENSFLAYIDAASSLEEERELFSFHPGLLEACFQSLLFCGDPGKGDIYEPVHVEKFILHSSSREPFYCRGDVLLGNDGNLKGDLLLIRKDGTVWGEIKGLVCQARQAKVQVKPKNGELNKDIFYKYIWQEKPLASVESFRGTILMFCGPSSMNKELVYEMRVRGSQVIVVKAGESYVQEGEFSFRIREQNSEDLDRLLDEISSYSVKKVVYCGDWGIDSSRSPLAEEKKDLSGIHSCLNGFHLLKHFFKRSHKGPLRFYLLTNGARKLPGEDTSIAIEQAALTGLFRTAFSEFSEFRPTVIDLDDKKNIVYMAVDELFSDNYADDIAFRDGKRYTHLIERKDADLLSSRNHLENCSLSKKPSFPGENTLFDSRKTYIVTGAFGGLGRQVVQRMAQNGARHFVFISRKGESCPEAARWAGVLRSRGISVISGALDITDKKGLDRLLTEVEKNLPPVKGIMHLAATVDDDLIPSLDIKRFEEVLRPKILGTLNLHDRTISMDLDFFVLFSSMSSLMGNPGQANYASANAFLDAFSVYRRSMGLKGTTVNWGGIDTEGMAADTKVKGQLETMGLSFMGINESLDILEKIMIVNPEQVGVMHFNWEKWKKYAPGASSSSRYEEIFHAQKKESIEIEENFILSYLNSIPAAERKHMVLLLAAELIAGTLHMESDKLDIKTPLPYLGVDSLLANELKYKIKLKFQVEVSAALFIKGGTTEQLAALIFDQLFGSSLGTQKKTVINKFV